MLKLTVLKAKLINCSEYIIILGCFQFQSLYNKQSNEHNEHNLKRLMNVECAYRLKLKKGNRQTKLNVMMLT